MEFAQSTQKVDADAGWATILGVGHKQGKEQETVDCSAQMKLFPAQTGRPKNWH